MAEKNKKSLTAKQEKALASLLSQPTIGLAASQAQIGERTLTRWLGEDSAFKSEYLRLRREVLNNAVFQLQKACNHAVNVLISVMHDPEKPANARVSAAVKVLELSFKAVETEDIEQRLTALEQRWENRNGH